jgi:microcompartment protein CcmL/EutN
MDPAVCLLEFSSVARGIAAGDAMAKRAPLQVLRAGTVHPGKYLVLVGGLTADVEEALDAGREVGGDVLVGVVYLPDVHPDVVASIAGMRRADAGEALGVIETSSVAATIEAADAGVKGARVTIRDLRLADDLGGKGYVLFGGDLAEVEAAVGHGVARTEGSGQEVAHVVVSQLHDEMRENLVADPRFGARVLGLEKGPAATALVPAAVVAPRGRPLPGSGGSRSPAEEAAVQAPPKPRSSPRARKSSGGTRRTRGGGG